MAKQTEIDRRLSKATVKKKYFTLFRTSILLSILILTIGILGTGFLLFNIEPGQKHINESEFLSYSYPIFISIGTILIALFTINLIWFRKNILEPLGMVENGIGSLKVGNYERKLRIKTNDEFEKIADSCNQIADKLSLIAHFEEEKKQYHDNLLKFLNLLNRASEGNLTLRAELTPDIFGSLADSFNLLLDKVSEFIKNIEKIKDELEQKLEEINQQVENIKNLELNYENRLSETELSTEILAEKDSNQEIASDILKETANSLNQASQAINENISNLHKISSSFQFSEQKLRDLSEKISEVDSPFKTLKDSANRINLHSLNISVEASKVGDEGKGIMILSGEIRTITEKILEKLDKASESMKEFQNHINPLSKTIEEVKIYINNGLELLSEIVSIHDKVERGISKALSVISESQNTYDKTEKIETPIDNNMQIEKIKNLMSNHVESLITIHQSLSEKISEISSLLNKFQINEPVHRSEIVQLVTEEISPSTLEADDIREIVENQEEKTE